MSGNAIVCEKRKERREQRCELRAASGDRGYVFHPVKEWQYGGEGEQRNLLTCSAGQLELEGNILCSPSPITFTSAPQTVTPEDIARGWQLCEVRTNCNVSYTMPEGATLATNWWVRGAFEDCSIVRLGDCSIVGYVNQSNNPNLRILVIP